MTITTPDAPKNKHDFKPGQGVSWNGYSDAYAGTVQRVTDTRVFVIEDKATLLNGFDSGEADALTMTAGGFAGHVEGRQRYSYQPGDGAPRIFTVRDNGEVLRAGSKTSALTHGRYKHYDYNF